MAPFYLLHLGYFYPFREVGEDLHLPSGTILSTPFRLGSFYPFREVGEDLHLPSGAVLSTPFRLPLPVSRGLSEFG